MCEILVEESAISTLRLGRLSVEHEADNFEPARRRILPNHSFGVFRCSVVILSLDEKQGSEW